MIITIFSCVLMPLTRSFKLLPSTLLPKELQLLLSWFIKFIDYNYRFFW